MKTSIIIYLSVVFLSLASATQAAENTPESNVRPRLSTDEIEKQIQGACFCLYNLLIGYMLFNIPRTGILPFLLVALVISAHLMGMDHLFYKWHANFYKLTLKWLMAISLIAGWLVGLTIKLPETFKASSSAFIAGGILINVITEKLPERERDHLRPFLAGVGLLVVIAVVMRSIPRF